MLAIAALLQASVPGIIEGIVKGIKGGKAFPNSSKLSPTYLDAIFSKSPFLDPSQNITLNPDIVSPSVNIDDYVVELDIGKIRTILCTCFSQCLLMY